MPIALVCTGQKYLGSLEKVTALSVDLVNEIREIRNEGKDGLRLGIPFQRWIQLLPLIL